MGKGRSHARVLTSIWENDDWRSLSMGAQWLYELILSQNRLSYCGVLPWTPARWARLAGGVTVRMIRGFAAELTTRRFLVVDEDTEEVWVRTFVRHDGILKSPNIKVAMWRDFHTILSEPIRKGFLQELPEGERKPLPEPPVEPKGKPPDEPLTEPVHLASRAHGAEPLSPSPSPPNNPPPTDSLGGSLGRDEEEDLTDFENNPDITWAVGEVAKRRLAKRADPPKYPPKWLETTAANVVLRHRDDLRQWAEQGLSRAEMADLIEPPEQRPPYHRPFGENGGPVWAEDEHGNAVRAESP